jgi:hypothetical protein
MNHKGNSTLGEQPRPVVNPSDIGWPEDGLCRSQKSIITIACSRAIRDGRLKNSIASVTD